MAAASSPLVPRHRSAAPQLRLRAHGSAGAPSLLFAVRDSPCHHLSAAPRRARAAQAAPVLSLAPPSKALMHAPRAAQPPFLARSCSHEQRMHASRSAWHGCWGLAFLSTAPAITCMPHQPPPSTVPRLRCSRHVFAAEVDSRGDDGVALQLSQGASSIACPSAVADTLTERAASCTVH